MMLNWPELWVREPGLRPEGLGFDPGVDPEAEFGAGCEPYWFLDVSNPGTDRTQRLDIPERAALALCRDAAVRWLGEEGQVPKLIAAYCGETWSWEVRINEGESGDRRFTGTLGAALFAACLAVLDARDAAKS